MIKGATMDTFKRIRVGFRWLCAVSAVAAVTAAGCGGRQSCADHSTPPGVTCDPNTCLCSSSLPPESGSGGSAGASSNGDAGATEVSPNPELVNCPVQRSALLDALAADSEPCATDDDCERYLAWSLPHDSRDCDGGWPIAHLDSHTADLDAKGQAVADCINKSGGELVGTCGINYGPHSTHCQSGRCELNPATL
jgi:hypothetical protein